MMSDCMQFVQLYICCLTSTTGEKSILTINLTQLNTEIAPFDLLFRRGMCKGAQVCRSVKRRDICIRMAYI